MLGLFSGASVPPASAKANAAANPPRQKSRKNTSSGSTAVATTMAASDVLSTVDGSAPTRSVHAFNAPDAEAILGMRRLLVKIVGAKDLPESAGSRRSCSAEVQLVSELGMPLGGDAMHERTGPPNHFTTVKDTAPVWNTEFVADVPVDPATAGLALRLAVWDDAAAPPQHLGECLIHADQLQQLCMREEERTLALEPKAPSAAAMAAGARPMAGFASGGTVALAAGGACIKVRLAYVDVRQAMTLLHDAHSLKDEVAHERTDFDETRATLETQLAILSGVAREEEERAGKQPPLYPLSSLLRVSPKPSHPLHVSPKPSHPLHVSPKPSLLSLSLHISWRVHTPPCLRHLARLQPSPRLPSTRTLYPVICTLPSYYPVSCTLPSYYPVMISPHVCSVIRSFRCNSLLLARGAAVRAAGRGGGGGGARSRGRSHKEGA